MKRVAIVQSNYIPWKGYFDLVAAVDEFILYDDMQYTRRDWRNRNLIKTPQGLQWLTVPVKVKGRYAQKIRDTELDGSDWVDAHWKAFTLNYRRAPHFEAVASWLEPRYRQREYTHLSELNRVLTEAICEYLGIETRIRNSWDYTLGPGKSERLADLCRQAGATIYLSGPSAKDYLDPAPFTERGVEVAWFDYEGYPPYRQLWGEFIHGVSVVDLLFNEGPDARRYLKYASERSVSHG
ncbi:MAG TPA: WbqC family protein [Burkholderiales bacterium]|nr:WbqC family protein [Burkholderiales bacterium]